jgi:neurotransmitter:Na+ symporter, NSS family
VFITLPNIFQQMTGGYFWALIFFVLLTVAALTSTISLLEVVVAYFSEELKMTRHRATIIAAVSITFLGVLCTLSQGPWSNPGFFRGTLFDDLEFLSANVMLPLGGLLIVIFIGWFMGVKNVKSEISNDHTHKAKLFGLFMVILKFIAPIAIALVFLNSIGLLKL